MVIAAPPATVLLPSHPVTAVSTSNPAPHGWTTHRVRSGDTLIGIATRYRTTVEVLAARNHLRSGGQIFAGTTLSVPQASAPARAQTAAGRVRATSATHVVRGGDTLSSIAARHQVSLASLLKTNRLSTRSVLQIGQKVSVRGSASSRGSVTAAPSSSRPKPAVAAYTVRAGDTLDGIARAHGTTASAIVRANGIAAGAFIHPGQRLVLSGSKTPARAAAKGKRAAAETFLGVTYPKNIAGAAARNRSTLAKRKVPSRAATKDLITTTARRHGVDPKLALAIGWVESGWNQRAVSPANAVGVMQVIPAGGQWASDLVGRRLDLLDPEDNVTAGVVMLRALGRSTSSTQDAVAAYYQGLASVRQRGMYTDTRRYVKTVTALRSTL